MESGEALPFVLCNNTVTVLCSHILMQDENVGCEHVKSLVHKCRFLGENVGS